MRLFARPGGTEAHKVLFKVLFKVLSAASLVAASPRPRTAKSAIGTMGMMGT